MPEPKTAVILVHYEDYAEKYFHECYQSLARQQVAPDTFSVFIVSNGAKKHAVKVPADAPFRVRFLDNAENLGWAGGNNTAIRAALAENYENIILLNMDTTLDERWLAELLDETERCPKTHIFQSKILLHESLKINSAGNRTHFLGYGYCHGYGRPQAAPLPVVDFASGASMMVRSEVFRKIGEFREGYFLYYDDMEFCWRARLAGYNIGVAEKSVCFHKYDFTNKTKRLYHLERNRLLTVLTLQKKGTLLLIALPLVLTQMVSGIYFTLNGHGKEQLRLYAFFLKGGTWKYIFKTRKEVSGLRVKKDRELVKNFSGQFTFAEVRHPLLKWFFNPLYWVYWNVVKHVIFW